MSILSDSAGLLGKRGGKTGRQDLKDKRKKNNNQRWFGRESNRAYIDSKA